MKPKNPISDGWLIWMKAQDLSVPLARGPPCKVVVITYPPSLQSEGASLKSTSDLSPGSWGH